MKKRTKKPTAARSRTTVPKFATEAEEADWWYKSRRTHSQEFLEASRNGEAQVLTKEKMLARIEASKKKAAAPMVSIRIPADDLALARKQAEKKGLPYQTYIKSLLHETLAQRERKTS